MIKNQYQVTWKLYREWLKENKTKGAKLAFLLFWTLLALVLFAIIEGEETQDEMRSIA